MQINGAFALRTNGAFATQTYGAIDANSQSARTLHSKFVHTMFDVYSAFTTNIEYSTFFKAVIRQYQA